MKKSFIDRLKEALTLDELTFAALEKRCTITYKMGQNPLPSLRKWVERNDLEAPVHYVESNTTPIAMEDLVRKVNKRIVPLIVVEAVKHQGVAKEVNIYVMDDELYDRRRFLKD